MGDFPLPSSSGAGVLSLGVTPSAVEPDQAQPTEAFRDVALLENHFARFQINPHQLAGKTTRLCEEQEMRHSYLILLETITMQPHDAAPSMYSMSNVILADFANMADTEQYFSFDR